jgi:hypothetical protein
MKKDNTLLWVGLGSVLVVGVVLFFVLRNPNKKGKDKNAKGDKPEIDVLGEGDITAEGNNIVVGDKKIKIDPNQFKIDFEKVKQILAQPVSKEKKYEILKQSGISDKTLTLVKNADAAEQQKKLSLAIKNIQQKERDAEFERLTGIKPRKFNLGV